MSCEINFKETAVQSRSQRPNSGNHPACPCLHLLSPPLPESPDAHAVSGSLNISFLRAHVLVTSQCLLPRWLCIIGASKPSYGNSLNQIFQPILSCPDMSVEVDLSCSGRWPAAHSQHSSMVQRVWPCAPRRVSLSDKYNQGHPLAPSLQPVGPGKVPVITLYLWNS